MYALSHCSTMPPNDTRTKVFGAAYVLWKGSESAPGGRGRGGRPGRTRRGLSEEPWAPSGPFSHFSFFRSQFDSTSFILCAVLQIPCEFGSLVPILKTGDLCSGTKVGLHCGQAADLCPVFSGGARRHRDQ